MALLAVHSAVAQGSIVALYQFDGNANDISGNNHHGTVNGPILATDRFGRPNSAYAFDGNDWIEVPHSNDLNFGSASTFTINAWVKACEDQSEFAGIVAKGPTNTFIPGYQLVVRNELPEGLISQDNGNFVGALGTTRILDSTWHMLTLIVSAPTGRVRIYVDGVLNTTSQGVGVDPSYRNSANLFIGKERNSTRFAKGAIDDVTIFDYALDDATIADMFAEGGWPFNAGNGSLTIATPDGTSLCNGGSVRLVASGSLRYRWSPATGLSDPNIANPIASPTTTTTYTVVGMREDFPCGTTTSSQVTITVGNPVVELGPTRSICSGGSVVLGQMPAGGSPPYRYAWSPAAGLDNPSGATPTASPAATTQYILVVTDASGCVTRDTVLVSVTQAKATLSTASLDFGELDGCRPTEVRTVTITNTGDTTLDLATTSVTGTGFMLVSVVPRFIGPGESAVVTVSFSPVANGAHSGRLTIASVPCNVDLAVDLAGTAVLASASYTPTAIDFGATLACVTTRRDTTIVITNLGAKPLTLSPAMIAAPFSIVSPVLPLTIPPGGSETLTVRCEPTADGTYSGVLTIPYVSGTCEDTMRIVLLVQRSGTVDASLSAATVDFGRLDGCSPSRDSVLTITNNGTSPFDLASLSVAGGGYVVVSVVPRTLAPGATGVITIRFAPGGAGRFDDTLRVHTEPCDADLRIPLTGIGASVVASVTPIDIDFGTDPLCAGTSRDTTIIVRNGGSEPLVIEAALVAPPFRVIDPVLPITIAPGESDTLTVRCDLAAVGSYSAVLSLPFISGSCRDTMRVQLRERRSGSTVTITGITDYGNQFSGVPIDRTQYVINTGSTDLAVDSIIAAAPFSIVSTSPAVPTVLKPGDTITVTTRFVARPGLDSAELAVVVSAPCGERRVTVLRGEGDERPYCRIYIPNDSARSGEPVLIRLKIDSAMGLKAAGAYAFRAMIAFDRTLLYPDPDVETIEDDSIRCVIVTGVRKDNYETLAKIPMTAMLGRVDSTALVIRSFEWIEPLAEPQVTTVDGFFQLIDNCPEGGERQYIRSGRVLLRPITPNPGHSTAVAEFELAEPGHTRLMIVDRRGRHVMTPFDGQTQPGRMSLAIDLSALAAGSYFLVLETPTIVSSQPFEVVR